MACKFKSYCRYYIVYGVIMKRKKKKNKKKCPYDDWACRVYSFCETKKCYERGEKLKHKGDTLPVL